MRWMGNELGHRSSLHAWKVGGKEEESVAGAGKGMCGQDVNKARHGMIDALLGGFLVMTRVGRRHTGHLGEMLSIDAQKDLDGICDSDTD